MKNNIRILLFILTILFIGTAATIRNVISETDILNMNVKQLITNLHHKEEIIDSALATQLVTRTFLNSERYPLQLRELSKKYEQKDIYFFIYKNSKPIFWSTNQYVPATDAGPKEGTSFISANNYSFVAKHKKLSNQISAVALIPIERDFKQVNNAARNNRFNEFFIAKHLRLASFDDNVAIQNIYSRDNNFLFTVKLGENYNSNAYTTIQIVCWLLAILCLLILINSICWSIARRGKPITAVLIMISTFFMIRIFDLETNWLPQNSTLEIFSPKKYAYNYFTPNLWSFLINSIAVFWVGCFCYLTKEYFRVPNRLKQGNLGNICFYVCVSLVYVYGYLMFDHLKTLITHTSFSSQDFFQALYSSEFSIYQIIIYSLNILSFVIFIDIIGLIGKELSPKTTTNLNIQLIVLVQFLIIGAFTNDYSLTNILFGLLIAIRSFRQNDLEKSNVSTVVMSVITLSLISTIKYTEATKYAQYEQMKLAISNLESDEDVEATSNFSEIENQIAKDPEIKSFFTKKNGPFEADKLSQYIRLKYFDGYMSSYDFNGYYFQNGQELQNYGNNILESYRERVISKSAKVLNTQQFYKTRSDIGTYEYFAILEIENDKDEDNTLIINLKRNAATHTKSIPYLESFYPTHILKLKNMNLNSYAIYKNGNLISQNGKYTYPNTDIYKDQKLNEFVQLDDDNGYFHLLFKPDNETSLLISRQSEGYWQFITIVSLCFLLIFIIWHIASFLLFTFPKYFKTGFNLRYLNFQLYNLFSKVRYSTRIQTLVISSVLIAIIISALISFISIQVQTQKNEVTHKLTYINEVVTNIEAQNFVEDEIGFINNLKSIMQSISNVIVTDFNLYDKNGKLFYTTQPTIYSQFLLSDYMNPDAFINLNVLKKNEIQIEEDILNFNYQATYASIQDAQKHTVAYLAIPYFNSQEIEDNNTGILLKTILNIYTVIIIVFAFLSVFISNKITEPLQLIRKKLGQINLEGKSNEPLFWEKNDEIGVLVKEYNIMLLKLEESAKQLRNAERENVWREMAQQVAHEVKNPLTPMKLGIQQLNRSFKENDPKFKDRFEKISNSFIEQIDTLSKIASEFSAFAKLPEAKFEKIYLLEKITKSIDVYNNTNNTEITLSNQVSKENLYVYGDKAQLLRLFNNLFKNAIEAAGGRKKIKIAVEIIQLDNNFLQVTVKDNGYGIMDDVLPNIFKPNFTTKSSGTGLGLAFVKQTLQGMGGKIDFKTKINSGTTFYLDIPIYRSQE